MALYEVDPSGQVWRLQQRQVGWRGQSGKFYTMDEDPSETERGSFAPMYVTVEADRVTAPETEDIVDGR